LLLAILMLPAFSTEHFSSKYLYTALRISEVSFWGRR